MLLALCGFAILRLFQPCAPRPMLLGIVRSGKGGKKAPSRGLSFGAKRHGACAVVAGVEVFVAGLGGPGQVALGSDPCTTC